MLQLLLSILILRPTSQPPTPATLTIPASQEHPGAAYSCPLDLPDDFFRGVSAACTDATTLSADFCCPALAAWLHAAYSSRALATHVQPSAVQSYDELPLLPGDGEPCEAAAEAALHARGVVIPGVNSTCGAVSCVCSVGLHPLQCSGPFVVPGGGEGRWIPTDDVAERLEIGCARPGIAGCTRCLLALYLLKSKEKSKGGSHRGHTNSGRECQLMGLAWLLSRNRKRYLPTAAYVLRTFRATEASGVYPTTCSVTGELPLPIGYEQLLGTSSFAVARRRLPPTPAILLFLLLIYF